MKNLINEIKVTIFGGEFEYSPKRLNKDGSYTLWTWRRSLLWHIKQKFVS